MNQSGEQLNTSSDILLYKGRNTALIPAKPSVSLSEGLEIDIQTITGATHNTKNTIDRFLLALASCKVIAESGVTPDAWANTRIQGDKVIAFGRRADSPAAWRHPVDTNARVVDNLDVKKYYNLDKLKRLFGRYMPLWESYGKSVNLFEGGAQGIDDPLPAELSGKNIDVWRNPRYYVTAIANNRHLSGYHIYISPSGEVYKDFARQWQTLRQGDPMLQPYIQASLEGAAISLGVADLLGGGGEIHNSGNWAETLKTVDEGGLLSLTSLASTPKLEKRRHIPGISNADPFLTTMHFHVYIPFDGGPVVLPPMNKSEVSQGLVSESEIVREQARQSKELWAAAGDLDISTLGRIGSALGGGKLTNWLNSHSVGSLVR